MDLPRRNAWPRGWALAWSLIVATTLLPLSIDAWAHAFVSRSEPRSGATLGESPDQVRIWFDGPIEPLFASLRVENGNGGRVDRGDSRVDAADARLLQVGLPLLPPGRYGVSWSVIARDGHPREGTFSFLIK